MFKRLRTHSEEILHDNPWWRYKHDQYEKPDGTVGDYWYGETRGGVMSVPITPTGEVVMVLQYRYLHDKQSIEFPGGGIREQLTITQAAALELKEETGFEALDLHQIGSFEPSNGYFRDKIHVFIVRVGEQTAQQLDDTEQIEVLVRRPDEIEEMIQRNDIWDGEALATWAIARSYVQDGIIRPD